MQVTVITQRRSSFAKTLQRHKSRPVTMLQARPHAIYFKRILDFGEGQAPATVSAGWLWGNALGDCGYSA
jgi:hypothetical protein